MPTEIETKVELSEKQFRQVLSASQVVSDAQLVNIYYDSNGKIARMGGSFRIRFRDGKAPQMTLKIPIDHKDGCWSATEVEEDLPHDVGEPASLVVNLDVPKPIRPYLQNLDIRRVAKLGKMQTHRTVARLPGGIMAEFDQVTLPNGEMFFEIEIENDEKNDHQAALIDIRAIIGEITFSEMSKFQRFLKNT